MQPSVKQIFSIGSETRLRVAPLNSFSPNHESIVEADHHE